VELRVALGHGFVVALGFVSACSFRADQELETFADHEISFRYPSGWHVSGFSTTNSPARVAVASFSLPADAVEGDCGGMAAVARLPADGALVLLFDYGTFPQALRPFPRRPATFTLAGGAYAEYECFGPGRLFRFRTGGRNFQAHVALGGGASVEAREQTLAILQSLIVESPTD
jgi:hypothetical protein